MQGNDIQAFPNGYGLQIDSRYHNTRPEANSLWQKAKKYLTGLILNKVVDIKEYGLDPYNRILGVIYMDGKNINLEMVRAGLAEKGIITEEEFYGKLKQVQAEYESMGLGKIG